MKKAKTSVLSLALAVLMLISLLAGCGSGTAAAEPTAAPEQSEPVAEPSAEPAETPEEEGEASGMKSVGERTFLDSAGREVTLDGEATTIAALRGSSYDKCLFFGKSKEVVMCVSPKSWAKKIFPDFNPIEADNPQEPNIEELVSLGVDLVLFWNTPEVLESLENVGIPAVVGSDEKNKKIESPADFMQWMQDDLMVYAQAIGGEGNIEKAQKWCDYAQEVFDKVTSRTNELSADEIPEVYYIRGPEVTSTHAKKSITIWYVTMAGGHLVTSDIDEKIAQVDVEQINAWNPDYIFMGRLKSTDAILGSDDFKDVKAVQNGNVYLNPCGVYEWDYGTEGVLFVQWLAKTLHPELFEDIDMEAEVKWYYKEFYNYDLTDDDVMRILNNMDPAE